MHTRPLGISVHEEKAGENKFKSAKRVVVCCSSFIHNVLTEKQVLCGHSKSNKTKILMANGSLKQVESIV